MVDVVVVRTSAHTPLVTGMPQGGSARSGYGNRRSQDGYEYDIRINHIMADIEY